MPWSQAAFALRPRSCGDLHELEPAGRPAPDGDSGLRAAEVLCDQRDQLLVGLPVYRRRFDLRTPTTCLGLGKRADARVWLDLHLEYECCHDDQALAPVARMF